MVNRLVLNLSSSANDREVSSSIDSRVQTSTVSHEIVFASASVLGNFGAPVSSFVYSHYEEEMDATVRGAPQSLV